MAESLYRQTESRRACIIPLFPKQIRDPLKKTVPDQHLFGSNFTGLVKQAKETEALFEIAKEQNKHPRVSGNFRGPGERRPFSSFQGNSSASAQNRPRLFFRGAKSRGHNRSKAQGTFQNQRYPGKYKQFNK